MASTLITPGGARKVNFDELNLIHAPEGTDTWFPIAHATVLDAAIQTLDGAGFKLARMQLAVSRGNNRFFGTLDLEAGITTGVSLAVGIRNSTDKSLPIAFCAGTRVFVCDNLAFQSEITVNRKHTRFGAQRFQEAMALAVGTLPQFLKAEQERVKTFQTTTITDELAEAMMLRSYERGILSPRLLPEVIEAWRKPPFEDFAPRTLWSLENCFTGVLDGVRQSNPQRFAGITMQLQNLLLQRPVKQVEAEVADVIAV